MKITRILWPLAAGFLGVAIYYTSIFHFTQNFYEIDKGKFYRSAQLSKYELENFIGKYGIKTVISLRGNPPGLFEEEPEAVTLKRLNVPLHSLALEMDYFPSKEDLNQVLMLLHDAPKPILVHCRSGADRTGMVSALYEMEEMKIPKEEALEQLSPKYLHLKAFHPAMDEFINVYQNREWAMNTYEPCDYPKFVEHLGKCGKKNQVAQ